MSRTLERRETCPYCGKVTDTVIEGERGEYPRFAPAHPGCVIGALRGDDEKEEIRETTMNHWGLAGVEATFGPSDDGPTETARMLGESITVSATTRSELDRALSVLEDTVLYARHRGGGQ